jgi:orotate phosphoribosyltransferase
MRLRFAAINLFMSISLPLLGVAGLRDLFCHHLTQKHTKITALSFLSINAKLWRSSSKGGKNVDYRAMIADTGAILEGDVIIALKKRGNVASKYVNLDALYVHPRTVRALAYALVEPWDQEFDVLVAPAVGAIPLLYTASLSHPHVLVAWADKIANGGFAFERMGFADAIRGRRVLALEDITSSGDTTKLVCEAAHTAGGKVVGVSYIWNRGKVTAKQINVPKITSLINEEIQMWKAEEHPHWGEWPLATNVGHPEYFPDYPGPRVTLHS